MMVGASRRKDIESGLSASESRYKYNYKNQCVGHCLHRLTLHQVTLLSSGNTQPIQRSGF